MANSGDHKKTIVQEWEMAQWWVCIVLQKPDSKGFRKDYICKNYKDNFFNSCK